MNNNEKEGDDHVWHILVQISIQAESGYPVFLILFILICQWRAEKLKQWLLSSFTFMKSKTKLLTEALISVQSRHFNNFLH